MLRFLVVLLLSLAAGTTQAATPKTVLVLGDSMTWGTGPAEEAWPRLAEARLGAGWEVLNFSHYGYDIAQSLAVLRQHGWAYGPDLVVYAAYTNDPIPSRVVEVGGGRVWVAEEGLFPRRDPGVLPEQ